LQQENTSFLGYTKHTMPLNSLEVYKNPENTNPKESGGIVETISREPKKLDKDVMSWLEKLERTPTTQTTQNADPTTGQQIAHIHQNIVAKTKHDLPATREEFVSGFAKTVAEVGRWLSVFVLRIIKKYNGEVKFKV